MKRKTVGKTVLSIMTVSMLALGLSSVSEASTRSVNNSFQINTYSQVKTYYTTFNQSYPWRIYYYWNPVNQPVTQQPVQQQPVQSQTPVQQPSNSVQQPAQNLSSVQNEVKQVLDLVNAERAKAGLAPLKLNDSMTKMSQVKAEDMRDHNYFSHQSPTYGSPFDMMSKFNISYTYAGENIAAGQQSAEEVMKSWMNSPGHKANILNKNYTEIGIGLAKGGSYGTYWVQDFRRP